MTKRKINPADYASDIMKALPGGILLNTKAGDKLNTMVIGWGTIGVNWGKPVFAAYIRKHRFTIEQLEKNPEFTISVPVGKDYDKKILKVCGSNHGSDLDKIAEAGLTPVEPETTSVPGFKEFPLTLECKVIYQQDQELNLFSSDLMKWYPQDVDGSFVGSNQDPHVIFFGEITDAYIIED